MNVTVTSSIAPNRTVIIDPWAPNPLLDDAMQVAAATVALARAENGEPPTMFTVGGDLPPFTASGVDPKFLADLPWMTRHAAAQESSMAQVLEWLQEFSSLPDAQLPSPGYDAYVTRFRDWMGGKWTNPMFTGKDATASADAADGLYSALFGEQESRRQAQVAAVNAANPPMPRTAAAQAAARAQR